jgi:predicted Zn-dependent protease with MMP-like domain
MEVTKRKAIMDYCQQTQQTLSEIIERLLKELAEEETNTEP